MQVMLAQPYDPWELGSFGHASYMLIKQFQYPLNYDEHKDKHSSADHDRLLMWNYDHFRKVLKEHVGTGELGIASWAQEQFGEKVLAFVEAALKPHLGDENRHVKWTGCRILGTVNRSNGYPVYSLQLFANVTGVEVYDDDFAPNVKIPEDDGEILDYNGQPLRRRRSKYD
jgi:hypothetical protein